MKNFYKVLFRYSLLAFIPVAANAAGTYYTGYYQSPQQGYSSQTYAQRQATNYNTSYANSGVRYSLPSSSRTTAASNVATKNTGTQPSSKKGFWMDAGIAHENAMWRFDMKESGSILSYDNVAWNVLDVRAGYNFDAGNFGLTVDAGVKYGMQYGESAMYDDDVTNGGYFINAFCKSVDEHGNCVGYIGDRMGHALSIGTSKGGNMLGFNAGLGLTDFFKLGNVRFTPSLGYRHFSYKLTTEKNYGLSVDTTTCFEIDGEVQCDPVVIFDGNTILVRDNPYGSTSVPDDSSNFATGDTFYYYQPGKSHSYEATWSGPYIAMDMNYTINQNNAVNGRVELGLPGYKSEGDQPYRFDWAHPKSVEDKAGIGSAMHFGLGANWTTAITNSVALSIGLTYDYYSVSGADAKTYLNENYYMTEWNRMLAGGVYNINGYEVNYGGGYPSEADMLADKKNLAAQAIQSLRDACPGWVCSVNKEVESIYRSLGIRVGINASF